MLCLGGNNEICTSYSWCKLVKIKSGMLFPHHITGVDLLFVDVHVLAFLLLDLACCNKGVDMRIKMLSMKKDAISSPTLKGSPSGDGHLLAGAVANPHYDLQPK